MSMFTLATSCLTTSNLLWFMNLTFQVPMQYYSLQHWTLLPSPVSSTTGYMYSPLYQSYVYTHLPFTSLKQFLRAISWAAVLILPQIKRLATLTLYIFLSRHSPLFPISLWITALGQPTLCGSKWLILVTCCNLSHPWLKLFSVSPESLLLKQLDQSTHRNHARWWVYVSGKTVLLIS